VLSNIQFNPDNNPLGRRKHRRYEKRIAKLEIDLVQLGFAVVNSETYWNSFASSMDRFYRWVGRDIKAIEFWDVDQWADKFETVHEIQLEGFWGVVAGWEYPHYHIVNATARVGPIRTTSLKEDAAFVSLNRPTRVYIVPSEIEVFITCIVCK
jgi:hypothetical protein